MDDQITELLNRMKLNNMGSSLEKEPILKGDKSSSSLTEGGKLGELMEDIENEFAELDELLNDVNLGQNTNPRDDL